MKKLFCIMTLFMLTSCSSYYKGEITDHFDGSRFYDHYNKKNHITFLQLAKWHFTKQRNYWPSERIAPEVLDIPPKRVYGNELRVSNIGHVTFLIQTQGLNIITDPVYADRASPVSFSGPKRIIDPGINFEDLPPIDLVLISHNHYDHMDSDTLIKIYKRDKPRIIVPLGNDTILSSFHKDMKSEAYDWHESVQISQDVKIHLHPAQHWSARGLFDRNKALWASFNIETSAGNIFFIGDTGYGEGKHFIDAKEKFKEFRLVLMPIGAYSPRWLMEYDHMNPEEAVKAHMILGSPKTVPSHYDVFKLTDEAFGDALVKLEEAKEKFNNGQNFSPMKVGEHKFF